jgi:hypothetical protein
MDMNGLEAVVDNLIHVTGQLADACLKLYERIAACEAQLRAMEEHRKAVAESAAGKAIRELATEPAGD